MVKHVYTFDSLSEFLTRVDKPKPVGSGWDTCGWDEYDSKWSGGTRAEAFEMARFGWPEGRKNMVTVMAAARSSIALPPAISMDVGGAYPDPGAAAAGAPDCMVSFEPTETRIRPIIRLAVNVWASCSYKPREFTNYGAALLSYIDGIESGGWRVELTMLCHCACNDGGGTYSSRVLIKRAEEPLDIDRAAYCLTHASMLRRLFFSHMQLESDLKGKMLRCGSPRNPDATDAEPGQIVLPGINIIPPGSDHLKSPAACAKYISSTVQDLLASVEVKLPELAYGGEGA